VSLTSVISFFWCDLLDPSRSVLSSTPSSGTVGSRRAGVLRGFWVQADLKRYREQEAVCWVYSLCNLCPGKGEQLRRITLILLTDAVTGLTRARRKRCQGAASCCFRNLCDAGLGQLRCWEMEAQSRLSNWSLLDAVCWTGLEKEAASLIGDSPAAGIHCVRQKAGSETDREGT